MDKNILKYKKELLKLVFPFIKDQLHLVTDVVFCGSRCGDWYTANSDIDIAISLDKVFEYDPDKNWFETYFKNYKVDIFLKPKEKINSWRGLKSPYYSLLTDEYFPGEEIDIKWLREHKPILRQRKNKHVIL